MKVYITYGRVLEDRPMRLLVYMALIARDQDSQPWFGQGHAVLAEFALGMDVPEEPAAREAVMRKVRRMITPLFAAGAICTTRRATYGRFIKKNVEYRLHLDTPCSCRQVTERPKPARSTRPQVTQRPVDNPSGQVTERPIGDESIGHSTAGHRSLKVRPQVTERPTKEKEEKEERRTTKENLVDNETWKAAAADAEPNGNRVNGHQASARSVTP